jgi:hypothetical protein
MSTPEYNAPQSFLNISRTTEAAVSHIPQFGDATKSPAEDAASPTEYVTVLWIVGLNGVKSVRGKNGTGRQNSRPVPSLKRVFIYKGLE